MYVIKDPLDESHETERQMRKHGIDNVRGGDYVQEEIEDEDIRRLIKRFRGADGACFNCGSLKHFINECTRAPQHQTHSTPVCYRCGRGNNCINDTIYFP